MKHRVVSSIIILISLALWAAGANALSGTNISSTLEDSSSPVIAIDKAGTIYAVWEEGNNLYYNYKTDGGWLTAPIFLSPGLAPSLAAGNDGTLHLVWADYSFSEENYEIYYTRRTDTGWDAARNVSSTSDNSSAPDIAIGPDGLAHVVWFEPTLVYYGVIDDLGNITTTFISNSLNGQAPAIAVSSDGTPYVVWQAPDEDTGKFEIFYSYYDGTNWSLPQDISQTPDVDSISPDITVTPQGRVYIAWVEGTQLYYRSGGSQGWGPSIPLSTGQASAPSIATDSQGMVHILWNEQDASGYRLVYGWGLEGVLARANVLVNSSTPIAEGALYPVSSGDTLNIHIVWSAQADSGFYDIFYGLHTWTLNKVFLPVVLRG
ncbi:MAG TPA: exo-alpha-sialidase [Chloroflexi bacterium]|nr:exo-alpha-sialidase [Chloroflexota bacterium]